MKDIKRIDHLLAKFYSADISRKEMDELFSYFLYTNPLPDRYDGDVLLIRSLAIERYCKADRQNMRRRLLGTSHAAPTPRQAILRPILCYAGLATGIAAAAALLLFLNPATAVAHTKPTQLEVYCNDNCDSQYIIDQFETSVYIK